MNGVEIEVVGIANNPSAGKGWWRADGSPLPVAPYQTMNGQAGAGPGQVAREFAVRVRDRVAGTTERASVRWSVLQGGSSAGGPAHDVNGRPIPDLEALAVGMPRSVGAAVVRADVAAGPWRTRFTAGPDGQVESRGSEVVQFSSAFEAQGGTRVIFVHGGGQENQATRVVAIDQGGRPHTVRLRRMVHSRGIATGEFQVNMPLRGLKEFQFQTRPFDQWIEIRNVCLDPAKPTKVETATSEAEGGL
jgi:hypothetical protein